MKHKFEVSNRTLKRWMSKLDSNDDWDLKDKRLLFRSLRNWGCDAECGLYPFDEDKKELILSEDEKKHTPKDIIKLGDYGIMCIDEKWYYFSGMDIDTLREKLIEDFIPLTHYTDWVTIGDVERIINKRFGVI